jgi:kynurenine formamidase
MSGVRLVDLSQAVGEDTPVFPGDGAVRVTVLEQGSMNLSRVEFSVHTGTHMDAPFHFDDDGTTIERVPLEQCMGLARLIDLRGIPDGGAIGRGEVESFHGAPMAVLHTGWSRHWGRPKYFSGHPVLSDEAAELLVVRGARLVGVDMPSVDRAPYAAHRVLLGAGVPIVENLTNLEAIGAEVFELIVLPLKLVGRDGAPVRAVGLVSPSGAAGV